MITRRRFLKTTGGVVAAGMAFDKGLGIAQAAAGKSKVVVMRNPAMMTRNRQFNEDAVEGTLSAALREFGGTERAPDVLARYVKPDDVVGLKINACFGERMNSTRIELVNALCKLLTYAGVKENNIIVWDRCIDELEGCGYEINSGTRGVRCLASLTRKVGRGGKPSVGFCDEEVKLGEVVTRYAKLAAEECSVIINMPVLKSFGRMDGHDVGITGALKNHFGSIEIVGDNIPPLHKNGCRRSIADVYAGDSLRQKTKLVICDAMFPLYRGGPGDDPRYHERYNGLIVAEDPVAMDTVGLDILNDMRSARGMDKVESSYLEVAAGRGLGTNKREQIEIVEKEVAG